MMDNKNNLQVSSSHVGIREYQAASNNLQRFNKAVEVYNLLKERGREFNAHDMCVVYASMREHNIGKLITEVKSRKIVYIIELEEDLRKYASDAFLSSSVYGYLDGFDRKTGRIHVIHKFNDIDAPPIKEDTQRETFRELEHMIYQLGQFGRIIRFAHDSVPRKDKINHMVLVRIDKPYYVSSGEYQASFKTKAGALYNFLRWVEDNKKQVILDYFAQQDPKFIKLLEEFKLKASKAFA